jgi:hypothetical protein
MVRQVNKEITKNMDDKCSEKTDLFTERKRDRAIFDIRKYGPSPNHAIRPSVHLSISMGYRSMDHSPNPIRNGRMGNGRIYRYSFPAFSAPSPDPLPARGKGNQIMDALNDEHLAMSILSK